MIENNITGLTGKIENEGLTSQGRLSAPEFNLLVDATIETQEKAEKLESWFIPISETDYEELVASGKIENRPYFIYEE